MGPRPARCARPRSGKRRLWPHRARARGAEPGRRRPDQQGDRRRTRPQRKAALEASSVGSGFQLLLDFGCFHDELREISAPAEGRAATTVAAPGATLLMLAWTPRRRVALPRGASREDIEAAFPAWRVVDKEGIRPERGAGSGEEGRARFYRLRRE